MEKLGKSSIEALVDTAIDKQMRKDCSEIGQDFQQFAEKGIAETYNGDNTDYHLAVWGEVQELTVESEGKLVKGKVKFSVSWEIQATVEEMEANFVIGEEPDGTLEAEIYCPESPKKS